MYAISIFISYTKLKYFDALQNQFPCDELTILYNFLVDVCGYTGEEDFYAMHKIIDEVIKPEDSGFSVDSMCIGGYFNKDGILVRTSSESPYDGLSFFYEPAKMSAEDVKKIEDWIETVVKELHARLPR